MKGSIPGQLHYESKSVVREKVSRKLNANAKMDIKPARRVFGVISKDTSPSTAAESVASAGTSSAKKLPGVFQRSLPGHAEATRQVTGVSEEASPRLTAVSAPVLSVVVHRVHGIIFPRSLYRPSSPKRHRHGWRQCLCQGVSVSHQDLRRVFQRSLQRPLKPVDLHCSGHMVPEQHLAARRTHARQPICHPSTGGR